MSNVTGLSDASPHFTAFIIGKSNTWHGDNIILLYGTPLQFGMQMVALLKHILNEFCMHDSLENGRQQVGQEGYVNGGRCSEGRIKLYT